MRLSQVRSSPFLAAYGGVVAPAKRSMVQLSPDLPVQVTFPSSGDVKQQTAPVFTQTTLPNGIKIATANVDTPAASLGLFVNAGPRSETFEEIGVSHFVRRLAYARTQTRSPLSVTRDMEQWSNEFACNTTRETTSYTAKVVKSNVAAMIYMLNDILAPKLHEYIIRDAAAVIAKEILDVEVDPESTFVEDLHATAFRGKGLGRSIYCPRERAFEMTPDIVGGFLARNYVAGNFTFVGVGHDHSELENLLKEIFTFPKSAATPATASPYTGGELFKFASGNTRFAVAFKGVGANSNDAAAQSVLTELLGGTTRYSRDGPGRGLSTRLARNVLQKFDSVVATSSFNVQYSDVGLWGVYSEVEGKDTPKVAELLTAELAAVKKGKLDPQEVEGAKNRAKAAILRGESKTDLFEHVAKKALVGGPLSQTEALAQLDKVTGDDIIRVAGAVLASDPTVVVVGNPEGSPSSSDIKRKL